MPRKKQTPASTQSHSERRKKAAWGGFIRCELTPQERDAFPQWVDGEEPNVFAMLDVLTKQGITFSVRLDEDNAAYVARLTAILGEKPETWILSGFHESVWKATLLVMFKHFVILDQDWSDFVSGGGSSFTWG